MYEEFIPYKMTTKVLCEGWILHSISDTELNLFPSYNALLLKNLFTGSSIKTCFACSHNQGLLIHFPIKIPKVQII